MIRIRFGEEMSRRNVSTPMQLRGWLNAVSADIGASSRRTVDKVEREIRMLKDYGYLQAYLQEYRMETTGVGPALPEGVLEAVRNKGQRRRWAEHMGIGIWR